VSTTGFPEANGNGTRRYSVDATSDRCNLFKQQRAQLEADYPGLVTQQVLELVCRQFEVIPKFRARELGGTWLYRTRSGFGVPSVYVYYEIDDDAMTVVLRAVHLAEGL
jgi:hypothetical protein